MTSMQAEIAPLVEVFECARRRDLALERIFHAAPHELVSAVQEWRAAQSAVVEIRCEVIV